MKKILLVLFCLILCSCNEVKREDYYNLSFGSYNLTVGYDNLEYLDVIFDFDLKETLSSNEQIKGIELKTLGRYFGKVDVIYPNEKQINSNEAIINHLEMYVDDYDGIYKIDDIELVNSISENCSKLNGTMVNKNGTACIIQKEVNGSNDVIILYGDILAENQDDLKRITIELINNISNDNN